MPLALEFFNESRNVTFTVDDTGAIFQGYIRRADIELRGVDRNPARNQAVERMSDEIKSRIEAAQVLKTASGPAEIKAGQIRWYSLHVYGPKRYTVAEDVTRNDGIKEALFCRIGVLSAAGPPVPLVLVGREIRDNELAALRSQVGRDALAANAKGQTSRAGTDGAGRV